MPYIKKEDRERALNKPRNSGELNYALTTTMLAYIELTGEKYAVYNDILSILTNPFSLPKPSNFRQPKNAIELGQRVAFMVQNYIGDNRSSSYNIDLKGCFFACALEFYRRMVGPYENIKVMKNGDVFPRALLTQIVAEQLKSAQDINLDLVDKVAELESKVADLQTPKPKKKLFTNKED